MSKKWQDLEKTMLGMLKKDNAKLTPGSGNSKEEEDVVGNSIICQCKYTADKNISILAKDFDRLLEASKLLKKFPIFVSQSNMGSILSIPLSDDYNDEISYILTSLMIITRLRNVTFMLDLDLNLNEIMLIAKEIDNITGLFKNLNMIKDLISELKLKMDIKIKNATNYNLFEENNANK